MYKKVKKSFLPIFLFSGLLVFSLSFFAVAQELKTSEKNIFLDSDQDGLSDEEERLYGTDPFNPDTDGDGYSDGVEVRSGYDPLKPAPGDKIIESEDSTTPQAVLSPADEENLTNEISIEIANLISQKEGENQDIALDDLDALIQQVAGEELDFDSLPEIDESEIKIKKQKYSGLSAEEKAEKEKKDSQEYLVSIAYILIANSPQNISKKEDLDSFSGQISKEMEAFAYNLYDTSYFESLAERGEKTLEQMKDVEVPEKHLDLHKKGLKLARYAVSLKDTAKPDPEDPVKTITNFSKVQSIINLSYEYSQEFFMEFAGVEISGLPIEF